MKRILEGEPYVPSDLVAYLDDIYTLNAIISDVHAKYKNCNDSFILGYEYGILDLLAHLRALSEGED